MATFYVRTGGGNSNALATYSTDPDLKATGAAASVLPMSLDDISFESNSGNMTWVGSTNVCRHFIMQAGYAGTVTNGGGTNFTFHGDVTLVSTCVTATNTGTWAFSAASDNQNLTSAGKTLGAVSRGTAATGTLFLQDALTLSSSASLTVNSGGFTTNGFNITASSFSSSSTIARTLTFGSSQITLSGTLPWSVATTTELTVTANTATVTLTASSPQFQSGVVNWNGLSVVFSGTTAPSLTGSDGFTIANLTRNGTSNELSVAVSFTVTGTLTLSGSAGIGRVWLHSSVAGTARTITCNGTVTASHADFEDIIGAGSASWDLSGISGGAGNIVNSSSGITFTTPTTRYLVATGNWSSTAVWSTTSGGVGGASYPICHDDVVLDAASGNVTLTHDIYQSCKNFTCTGFTGTYTMASNGIFRQFYGNFTLAASMTATITPSVRFAGRGSHTIDMAGKVWATGSNRPINFGRFGGTFTLLSDFKHANAATANTGGIRVEGGCTLDMNGFNLSSEILTVSTGGCTLLGGTGTITLWTTAVSTLFLVDSSATMDTDETTIVIAAASANLRAMAGAGKTYGTLTYTVAGSTGVFQITGSNTFNTINFSDATNARTLRFAATTTTTITNFNVNGTAGKLMTVNSLTAGSQATLTKAGGGVVSSDYLSVKDIAATPATTWYAGANSTDAGNNTGWIFTVPPAGGVTVEAVPATATAQAEIPAVTGHTVVEASTATATAQAPTPAVSAGATVVAEPAVATAQAPSPVVTGGAITLVVPATATAQVPIPAVDIGATVEATSATATAQALEPVISTGVTVLAVSATASAQALEPAVTVGAITFAVPATATAQVPIPVVVTGATIAAVTATATAQALAPVVSGAATVLAVPASATAAAAVPTVSTGVGANVLAVPATATAQTLVPTISGAAVVLAAPATAIAATPNPVISAVQSVVVLAVPATATAQAHTAVISGGAGVLAVSALATAQAHAALVTAVRSVVVFAISATATAQALPPAYVGMPRNVTVKGVLKPRNKSVTIGGGPGTAVLSNRRHTTSLGGQL